MIEAEAFSGCTNLSQVELPEAQTIKTGAFSECDTLETARFEKAENIEAFAFSQSGLKSIWLKGGSTHPLLEDTFDGETRIRNVSFVELPPREENVFGSLGSALIKTINVTYETVTPEIWDDWYASPVVKYFSSSAQGDDDTVKLPDLPRPLPPPAP
jgi:hypothetical protein